MSLTRRAIAAALVVWLLISLFAKDESDSTNFGYDPNPQGAAAFRAMLPFQSFAAAAPDAMVRFKKEDTFLWRAMDAAHRARYDRPFKCSRQTIGSCVAHGAAHAVYCSESVAWALGERQEPPRLVHQAAIYGGSRVEARGKPGDGARPYGGYSDGSTGYHAAKWLKDWGVIYIDAYADFDWVDTTYSDGALEKAWGAYGCGGQNDNGKLDEIAKQTPCLHVVAIKNWEELCAAITSGHPVTLASSQGFSTTLDRDSFAAAKGTWLHQMCCVGLRFDREGAAIMNSWGDYLKYTAPRWPEDLPDGVFWADRRTVERMLAQGDCWAISEVAFKWRDISHHDWMDR